MIAAVKAVLEQAKRLTPEERAELQSALLDLDQEPDRPVVTREAIDRQLASSIAQAERGEFVDEASVLADLDSP
jgi:predicted transcriptional regulator